MSFLSTRLAASALSFAHLASVGRGKQAKADDKDKDYRDDKDKEASAESDDENDTGDGDSKEARADDPNAEDDDDDDENKKQKAPDGKKSKRAKAEEDDDAGKKGDDEDEEDDSEELRGKSAIARARLREQARCAAIMGCRAAARNVPLAARLALTTRMSSAEAIGVLESTPAADDTSASRAARNPRLGNGGEKSIDQRAAVDASWDRAFAKVGAVRRK